MKQNKKSIVLLVSLALLLTVTVGGTLAFLVAVDGPLTNTFTPSEITTEVEEKLDGQTKKDVKIQNTGDIDAWIRATVVITWQDKDGNVYGQMPVAGTDYSISYDLANGWVKGDDGFYYWTKPVAAEKETGVLIKSCTVGGATAVAPPSGYNLNVEIIGSGIQSKPAAAFNQAWASSGLTPNEDCTALVEQ